MALKAVVGFNGGFHELGKRDLMRNEHLSAPSLSWRLEVSKSGRLEFEGVRMKPVNDEKVSSSSASSPVEIEKETGMAAGKRSRERGTGIWHLYQVGSFSWYCFSSYF